MVLVVLEVQVHDIVTYIARERMMAGLFISFTVLQLIGIGLGLLLFAPEIHLFLRITGWILFINYTMYDRIDREFKKLDAR